MPKQVCRIRWRKGEPLGLVKYPTTTFLDLPREIRDQIYHNGLVSSDPLTVWSGHYHRDYRKKNGKVEMKQTTTVEPIDPNLKQLTRGLLYCSHQIAPKLQRPSTVSTRFDLRATRPGNRCINF